MVAGPVPAEDQFAGCSPSGAAALRPHTPAEPSRRSRRWTEPVLPMMPGTPERRSHDYVRHGTIDLFARPVRRVEQRHRQVIGYLSAQYRAVDFRDFLDEIDRQTDPPWPST
jgi:hypothetical protein